MLLMKRYLHVHEVFWLQLQVHVCFISYDMVFKVPKAREKNVYSFQVFEDKDILI